MRLQVTPESLAALKKEVRKFQRTSLIEVRKATKVGAELIANAIRSTTLFVDKTGRLRRSIQTTVAKQSPSKGWVRWRVANDAKIAPHYKLIALGHKQYWRNRRGNVTSKNGLYQMLYRGQVKGIPYFETGLSNGSTSAITAMESSLRAIVR